MRTPISCMWQLLTAPAIPRLSLQIGEQYAAMVELRRQGGLFQPRRLAVVRLPEGLVQPDFTRLNISDDALLEEHLQRTAGQAGVSGTPNLTLALPEGSARSLIISLDSVPDSRAELQQMLEWKTERSLGEPFADLRISQKRLTQSDGRSHWLVVAAREEVVAQYEGVLAAIGWHAGLVVPQHLGAAQLLMRSRAAEDQALVSLNETGFAVVVVRGAEPILVRSMACEPQEREDEFYRLMVFYRDHLLPAGTPGSLNRILTIGSADEQERFQNVLGEALDGVPQNLNPASLGLNLEPSAPFTRFAAAAGLSTLGWNN
jgi:Tfp pilus assembly PilM family ATPase